MTDQPLSRTLHIDRTPGGVTMVNGAEIIRSEWVNGMLTLVTADGEYDLPLSFEQFLNLFDDDGVA